MTSPLFTIAINDFKLIFRDPSLRGFLVLPLLIWAIAKWLLPYLADQYEILVPYLPVFIIVLLIENTQPFSFISGMVLIEEKESNVNKVYGVVPVSKKLFMLSRLVLPYLITAFLNVGLFFIQPFFEISIANILLISFLAALVVPVYVLALNSYVKNKLEGMVYVKVFNVLVLVPVAAFFVPEEFKNLFGIFPTHWLFLSVDRALADTSPYLFLAVGFVFLLSMLWWFLRMFVRKHFD